MTEAHPTASEEFERRIAAMSPAELEARRREIVVSANGQYENLTTDQLSELAYIVSSLRRRNSGPPKEAKVAGSKTKPKATLDSLLDV